MASTMVTKSAASAWVAANGLQVLAEAGVPEGALSALLIALAVLTALPFVAGRDFGPYTAPDVLQGGTFWLPPSCDTFKAAGLR
jgi:hypothetical protein